MWEHCIIHAKIYCIIIYQLTNERGGRIEEETAIVRERRESQSPLRLRLQHLGYHLNNSGKDFSEYNKEFKLRTDAVW
jgi:hypothetical protein